MEELPFHSDDNSDDSGNELVKETSTKIVKLKIDYTPLSLDQEWFVNSCPTDKDECLTVTKYQAHLEFRRRNYDNALKLYEKCIQLLPPNANLLLKEIYEAKARCLIELEKFQDAENTLNYLLEQKGNPQDSSLWSLLSDVYQKMDRFENSIKCLGKCLNLHPDYVDYWISLANAYCKHAQKTSFEKHLAKDANEKIINQTTDMANNLDNASVDPISHFIEYFSSFINKKIFNGNKKEISSEIENSRLFPVSDQNLKRRTEDLEKTDQKQNGNEDYLETKNEMSHDKSRLLEEIFGSTGSLCGNLNLEDFSCNCFDKLSLICSLKKLFNTNSIFEEKDRTTVIDGVFKNGGLRSDANGITKELMPGVGGDLHFFIWRQLLEIVRCCATVKAWNLCRKSVQNSKGFAKKSAEAKLLSIEKRALQLLVAKIHVERLAEILEDS